MIHSLPKNLISVLYVCSLSVLSLYADDPPPNIVLILVDDVGYASFGAYGSEIHTPHIDQLANTGIRFTHFYNQAKCSPTRGAIHKGAYTQQIPGNSLGANLPNAMAALGYRTLYVGKEHGSGSKNYQMRSIMTPASYNHFNPGVPRPGGEQDRPAYTASLPQDPQADWVLDNQTVDVVGGGYVFPEDFYSTSFFTDTAVRYIETETTTGQPFFLYLAYTAAHWPLQALPEDLAVYEGAYNAGWDVIRAQRFARQQALGLLSESAQLSPREPNLRAWNDLSDAEKADYARRMETYAAMVHRVDLGVGRIVDALKARGDYENTLIVLLSDNGATNQSYNLTTKTDGSAPDPTSPTSYIGFGPEWCNAANAPFRGHKRMVYEGGAHTPFIVHWPQGIPANRRGEINASIGHVIDLLPTFVEAGGGTPPANIEGLSLMPIIETGTRSGADEHPFIGMQYSENLALRMGDMKIVSSEGRNWGLFDMSVDPTESTDLSAQPAFAPTLANLESKFDEWATRGGVGVRKYFIGAYDGGPDQGEKPVPGNGGAILISNVSANGFDIDIAAASDHETAAANLVYASYWSYRGDLETVEEILTYARMYNNWQANRSNFSIPRQFYRGSEVYGYVLVRDEQSNISVYHGGAAAAIPYDNTAPTPGIITSIIPGRDSAEIRWTAATDDQPGLKYALFVADQPMTTVGEAFCFGRLVKPISENLTSDVANRLPKGKSHFAVVVIDSDDNAVLYPVASGMPAPQVDLAVGSSVTL